MILNKINKILIFILTVSIVSCSSEDSNIEVKDFKKEAVKTTITKVRNNNKTAIKIPSPVDLYIFLQNANIRFNKDLLSPTENVSNYYTSKSKALNFGIYASDLAYCTAFTQSQETFHYFKASKSLADELGLSEGFDEIISNRIGLNMNNTDSLYEISADAYSAACRYLESEKKHDILGLILVGSWVESVNIAIKSVKSFDPENEVVIRIAEQQFLLENLTELLASIESKELESIKSKLANIQISFDKLYDNTDVIITKEQFSEISAKIQSLRAELIK